MLESLHGIRSKELKATKDRDLLRYNSSIHMFS
jgi:hypothetical protein